MKRWRSWPHASALVAFVVALGVLPHIRFSLLVGEPAYFFSAFDEDQYSFWALVGEGPTFPSRWLSSAVLTLLTSLGAGSWELALMLADAVLPAASALLAWSLCGHVTRMRLLRLLLALGLLFAQELLSLGCWTIWQVGDVLGMPAPDSRTYDLRFLYGVGPAWLRLLWPDYTAPFLTAFRTPEPQISRVVLFAMLGLLISACAAPAGAELSRRRRTLGLLLNAALAAIYFSQAAAIVVFEGALCLTLFACRRSKLAWTVGGLAAVGGASLLLGTFAHLGARNYGVTFSSRVPVVTPSVVAAIAGLLLLATVLRRSRGRDLYPVAAALFGSVLVLTNQHVLTGRMVLTSTWERYVDYPLVFLAAAIVAAWLLRGRLELPSLYGFAGAGLVLTSSVLLKAQDRVFEHEYLTANLESVAMRRAVEAVEAMGYRQATWLLEDPGRALMLQFRLRRRIDHLLDVTRLFVAPVDPMARPDGAWGVRSNYTREVFEYLARRPRTPAAVARLLRQESETGAGDILRFLFDYRDYWAPMTDGRRARSDDVRAAIPGISSAFARYQEGGDPCWLRPVVVLTRQAAADRVSERWSETFLVEATVGRDGPIMNMNTYLQTLSDRDARSGEAASTACAAARAEDP